MTKTTLISALLATSSILTTCPAASQEPVPFASPRWHSVASEVVEHLGRPSLRGTAVLSDARIRDGVIEFDLSVDGRRSYPGVLFRIRNNDTYEHVYIRPHRAGLYPDAIQYAPTLHGSGAWQLYSGEGYTALLQLPRNEWVPVRIEVRGSQARVFVGGGVEPVLVASHLQLDAVAGPIGLSGPTDGSAYFSNFRYREEADLSFAPPPAETAPAGTIRDWWISRTYPADRVRKDQYPHFYSIFGAGWKRARANPSGVVDIARTNARQNPTGDLVFARTFIRSEEPRDVTLTLGYSDDVEVYLNGRHLFSGRSGYQSRDPSFLGILGPFDALHVKLERGLNEVLLMVTERFGGWGFSVATDPPTLPTRTAFDAAIPVWETDEAFLTSESVVFDSIRSTLYVSSFDNEYETRSAPSGFISRVSLDGRILEKEWVTGLRAPTGMAIWKDTLFVAEREDLTAIDIRTGRILNRWPIPDVDFPNDVAVDTAGNVYVSDTRPSNWDESRIYRFRNGRFDVFANQGISRANGLFVHDGKLLVGSSGDGLLKSVDLRSGRVESIISLGAGIIDGIRVDERGNYLVSHWEGQVYRISPDGSVVEILDTLPASRNTADFEYLPAQHLLIVPTFLGNSLAAYRLSGP